MIPITEELRDLKDELRQAAEALRDSLRLQNEIIERFSKETIIERMPIEEPKIYPYFTYPKDGTKKTLGKGITEIDFWEGIVVLADGTEEYLSDKLESYNEPYIRSFQIDTNKDIKVWLDGFGKRPIDLDDIHMETHQNFRRLYIETTQATQIHLWASTNPRAFVRRLKPAIFRGTINEYYTRVNPLSEFGNPIAKLGHYAGSATSYQNLATWTIPANYYGYLREISFTADSLALYKLTIGGVEQFADKKVISPPSFPLPANKIVAAKTIILQVKSAGGNIEVNGTITGKTVPII